MHWYRCFIRGENFPRQIGEDREFTLCGFYTTRWVEAETPQQAETAALALLRAEDNFKRPTDFAGPVDARVYFEEIVATDGPQVQGGASWFVMSPPDQS